MFFSGGETNAEDYVVAFFKNDAKTGNAVIYLYNPYSSIITYSVTTPLITVGGINVVNRTLPANNSTSVTVSTTFFLDETGADLSRGIARILLLCYIINSALCVQQRLTMIDV